MLSPLTSRATAPASTPVPSSCFLPARPRVHCPPLLSSELSAVPEVMAPLGSTSRALPTEGTGLCRQGLAVRSHLPGSKAARPNVQSPATWPHKLKFKLIQMTEILRCSFSVALATFRISICCPVQKLPSWPGQIQHTHCHAKQAVRRVQRQTAGTWVFIRSLIHSLIPSGLQAERYSVYTMFPRACSARMPAVMSRLWAAPAWCRCAWMAVLCLVLVRRGTLRQTASGPSELLESGPRWEPARWGWCVSLFSTITKHPRLGTPKKRGIFGSQLRGFQGWPSSATVKPSWQSVCGRRKDRKRPGLFFA
ncbi:uncharacterized protein LOC109118055 [Fukomys damarensis]|uniref:uncharacterized protein LOC109118055 n=1 Tax=Fukomys damarensis TaxID=885580 RepID=UPI0008FEB184|nr:uncharacterized protein LOC109118055 [Fukomys damarensis]XP_019062953.1 uncharacterized protein LOC109118055 [Fukomys damarensis]XP_019062954.1 uncharacterized protein LOC109118055 [Fukomys damarensis]